MIVVYVERWTGFDGTVAYPWSVWRDGTRVEMGGPFETPELAEAAARLYCRKELGAEPDRIRRL
jgi:hypothetical protein